MKYYRCERCKRRIKHPHWVNDKPYGKYCATQVKDDLMLVINELQADLQKVKDQLRTLLSPQDRQVSSSKIVKEIKAPLMPHMGYGGDHSALMVELKSALKEREVN